MRCGSVEGAWSGGWTVVEGGSDVIGCKVKVGLVDGEVVIGVEAKAGVVAASAGRLVIEIRGVIVPTC